MLQRLPFGEWPASRVAADVGGSVRVGLAAGLAIVLAVYLGLGVAFLRALPTPALDLAVASEDGVVAADVPLVLTTMGLGTTLSSVRLTEYQLDGDGDVVAQREVPVRYQSLAEGRLPGEGRGALVRTDGSAAFAYDARYTLDVRAQGQEISWRGPRTVPLAVATTFRTAPMPRATLPDDQKLTYGEPLTVAWSVPITEFAYRVEPTTPSHAWLSEDGLTAFIGLDEFAQSTRYEIEITSARAASGAPLAAPVAASVTTPAGLRVTGFTPTNGARDVAPGEDPIITFSAPVANPEAAADAILVEPPVDGRFRWLAPNRVQFVTDKGFAYSTDVTFTVRDGPAGLRSEAGGFVDEEAVLGFRTRVYKRIDVDLRRQMVTLLEDEQVVFTTLASTGVRGAETPVGNWKIQYKMEKTRMRGTNPDGHTYDIPDVPWVMALFGDYALHGAPWRQAWGVPLSNGCVSMPTPAAKRVYDWTPVGTPVTVHY